MLLFSAVARLLIRLRAEQMALADTKMTVPRGLRGRAAVRPEVPDEETVLSCRPERAW